MADLSARPCYRPSGRVPWDRFLPGVLLTLAAGVACGWALACVLHVGWYVGIVAPMLAAAPAGGVLYLTIKKGRCRNPVVACLLGVATVLVVMGAYFRCDQVRQLGPARLTGLPAHVRRRMRTDRQKHVAKGWIVRPAGPNAAPVHAAGQVFNWFGLGLETLGLLVVAVGIGQVAASAPFSEEADAWLSKEQYLCTAVAGLYLVRALREGWPIETNIFHAATPQNPHTCLTLFAYQPAADEEPLLEAYLSAEQVDGKKRQVLFRHLLLAPEEAAALVPCFASLRQLASTPPH